MGETKILKFDENDDVFECIKEFAQKNNIEHAFIKDAKGSIKNFEISSFAGKGSIENIKERSAREITAINGQLTASNGIPELHLKVSVSRPGLSSISGKLLSAKAVEGLEIALQKSSVEKIIYA